MATLSLSNLFPSDGPSPIPVPIKSLYRRGYFVTRRLLGARLSEQLKYMKAHHRWPRTSPPVTFTEKILARKLAPPDPRYQIVSDKVAVRPWVAQRIGEAHLVPALAVYGYDELDRLELAPGQVLKCANRSGGVYFSDEEPDRKALITKLRQHLDFNFGDWTGETWYADVPRRVLVEQALRDEHGRVPCDYKLQMFHGVPQAIQVHLDRFGRHTCALFDRDWQPLPNFLGFTTPDPLPERPRNLERMLEIAEALGGEFDCVRVDLYDFDDQIYFGELTLAPSSGARSLGEYDRILGSYW